MYPLPPWEMDTQGKGDLYVYETLLAEITSKKLNKA